MSVWQGVSSCWFAVWFGIKCKPGFILVGHLMGTEISDTSLTVSLLVQIAAAAADDDDDDHDDNDAADVFGSSAALKFQVEAFSMVGIFSLCFAVSSHHFWSFSSTFDRILNLKRDRWALQSSRLIGLSKRWNQLFLLFLHVLPHNVPAILVPEDPQDSRILSRKD